MRSMFRWLAALVVTALLVVGVAFFLAGRQPPPEITIEQPAGIVGQRADLRVRAAGSHLQTLTIVLEQNGRTFPLFSRRVPELFFGPNTDGSTVSASEGGSPVTVERPIGKQSLPELQEGPARIVADATSTSFLRLRTRSARVTKDVQVHLQPPRISV